MDITIRPAPPRRTGTLVAWLQLMRLPNLFTAMADVAMGFLLAHPRVDWGDSWTLGLLLAASSCLYTAGMVLNDVFDFPLDCRERPERPLPSGRISLGAARRLGWGLLAAGLILGLLASVLAQGMRPAVAALLLAGCVVLYDTRLKPTLLGPLGMGACRALNVLFGASAAAAPWRGAEALAAVAIGVYVAGITWFARREAHQSRRGELLAAALVMLAGIAMLGLLPAQVDQVAPILRAEPGRWPLLLAALGALVGVRLIRAMADPRSILVRLAVRQSVHSLIVLDAAVAFLVHDLQGAIPILLLLVPTLLLARWVYST
jgi:4-hydroxybenzoate polyprenyltransferase